VSQYAEMTGNPWALSSKLSIGLLFWSLITTCITTNSTYMSLNASCYDYNLLWMQWVQGGQCHQDTRSTAGRSNVSNTWVHTIGKHMLVCLLKH